MTATITLHALDLSGETSLKLYLRKDDGTLLNTGGDALSEIGSSGVFEATLTESRSGLGDLSYRVCDGTEVADNLLIDGFLPEMETTIGASVTAVLDSAIETAIESAAADAAALVSRLTSERAANLDNLDVAISVIQSQITALNNLSAKANWFGALLLEVPDSGTREYVFELVVKDDEDKLVNLDGSPTIALVNAAGTDRSSLITTAIANPSTGRYTLTVTVGTGTVNESLKLTASGTVSGESRYAVIAPQVVDYDTATQVALLLTRIGTPAVSVSADIASVKTDTGTTLPGLIGDIVGGATAEELKAELFHADDLSNKLRVDAAGVVTAELSSDYDPAKTAATQDSVDALASAVVAAVSTINTHVEAY